MMLRSPSGCLARTLRGLAAGVAVAYQGQAIFPDWRQRRAPWQAGVRCSGAPEKPVLPVTVHMTGFGPFGGVADNPTSIICRVLREFLEQKREPEGVCKALLQELCASGLRLRGLDVLEVSAQACREEVPKIVEGLAGEREASAVAIVHLGVSGSAKQIHLECRGVNVADFRIPDVRGCQTRGEPVVANAEPALFTALKLPELLCELSDGGVSCQISTDAGRYLCNYVFFTSLHAAQPQGIPVLFVHVPPFEVMSKEEQVAAVIRIVLAIARQLRGLPPQRPGGSEKPMG